MKKECRVICNIKLRYSHKEETAALWQSGPKGQTHTPRYKGTVQHKTGQVNTLMTKQSRILIMGGMGGKMNERFSLRNINLNANL